jgi:LAO/AO transport system kinase
MRSQNVWLDKRRTQALDWMWQIIEEDLRRRFRDHAGVRDALEAMSTSVAKGELSASAAAARLLDLFAAGR